MNDVNIRDVAEWIFETGAKETTSGSWIIYKDEIFEKFGVDNSWWEAHVDELINAIFDYGDINILELYLVSRCDEPGWNGFDIAFGADCVCERCKGIKNRSIDDGECACCDVMMGLWNEEETDA